MLFDQILTVQPRASAAANTPLRPKHFLKGKEPSWSPAAFPSATCQEPTRSASRKRRKLYSGELSAKLFHYTQDFYCSSQGSDLLLLRLEI